MRTLILTVFTLLTIPLAARAEEPSAAPVLPTLGVNANDAAPLREANGTQTVNTIDGATLHLKSGETIELSGIWIPPSQGYDASDEQVRAKIFLDSLFENQNEHDILLYQTNLSGQGRVNRLGHDMAHVVRKTGNVWLQGALIANGYAQAWPTPSNPELAGRMYVLEDEARAAGKGLWAKDSPYRLLQASDDMPNLDRFAVVEGAVQSISMINNETYLNFGPDWKTDFTLGISSPLRQKLARNNIDLTKMQGQHLRVRGWLRFYNGPYIELEDPVQLETLDIKQENNIVPGSPELSIINQTVSQTPIVHSVGTQKKNAP